MKTLKSILPRAALIFLIFTILCGVLYTGVVTGIAQLIFPEQANGSIIEVDGKKYGSALLGQQYTDETHMWGRVMNIDVSTYKDKDGKMLMYAAPSNLTPASEEYAQAIAERVEKIRAAHPEKAMNTSRLTLLPAPAAAWTRTSPLPPLNTRCHALRKQTA